MKVYLNLNDASFASTATIFKIDVVNVLSLAISSKCVLSIREWTLLFCALLQSSFSRYAFATDLADLTDLEVDFYSKLLYVPII